MQRKTEDYDDDDEGSPKAEGDEELGSDDDEDDGSDEEDEPVIIDWLRVMPEFDLSKTKSIKSKVVKQVMDDDMLEESLGLFKKWEKSST